MMGPTIEALTIHPAAWAELFQGLAEGIAYGLAIVASVLVATVALVGWLGRPRRVEEALGALGLGDAPAPPAVRTLWVRRGTHPARRRPRPTCPRVA